MVSTACGVPASGVPASGWLVYFSVICVQISSLESESKDVELKHECLVTKACMAYMLVPHQLISHVLSVIKKVRLGSSIRAACGVISAVVSNLYAYFVNSVH